VVVFRKYAGTEFKIDEEEHLIVDSEDILGVVEG
jgi:chaperonin GroES